MKLVSVLMVCILLLAGCGGGGDDSSSSAASKPAKPTISMQAASYDENTRVTISPTVSTAGSIASYEWRVVTGDLTLDETATKDLVFSVPSVAQGQAQIVTLELTVTDNHQQSTSTQADFTFNSVSPIVTMPAMSIREKDTATYTVQIDELGQEIASVEWGHDSGYQYEFIVVDERTIEISAPEVKQNTVVSISATVTDSDGDVVTEIGQLSFDQITIPLTISGVTLDRIEAGADVVVTNSVDGSTYTAQTVNAGEFSVDIVVDDDYANGLVLIEIQGNADQPHIHFMSILGQLSTLVDAAATDGVVSVDQVPALSVNHFTTAEYGLVYSTADDEALADYNSYTEALLQIGYHDVVHLAAAVMAYIENDLGEEFTSAPDSIHSSRHLVEQVNEAKDFIYSLYSTQTFEDEFNNILTTNLLVDENPWVLEDEYFLVSGRGFLRGDNLQLVRDGVVLFGHIEHAFEFNGNSMSMNGNHQYLEAARHPIDDAMQIANVQLEISRVISKIKSSSSLTVFQIKSVMSATYTFDDGATYDDSWGQSYLSQAVPRSYLSNVRDFDLSHAYLPLDSELFNNELDTDDDFYHADEFVFNANGSGTMTITGKDFVWSYVGSKLEVLFGGTRLLYSVIDRAGEIISVATSSNGEASTRTSYGVISGSRKAWQIDEFLGVYTYKERILNESSQLPHYFWVDLRADGTGTIESLSDYDKSGQLTADEHWARAITWYLDGSRLVLQHSNSSSDQVREWLLVKKDNGEYAILQSYSTFYHFDGAIPSRHGSTYRLLEKSDTAPIDVTKLPH